jgi:hypothetical protein
VRLRVFNTFFYRNQLFLILFYRPFLYILGFQTQLSSDDSKNESFVLQSPVNRDNLKDAISVIRCFRSNIVPTAQSAVSGFTNCVIDEKKTQALSKSGFQFSEVSCGRRVVFPRGPVNLYTNPVVGSVGQAASSSPQTSRWKCIIHPGVAFRNSPTIEDRCNRLQGPSFGDVVVAVDRIGADQNWLLVNHKILGQRYLPIMKDDETLFEITTEEINQSFVVGCKVQLAPEFRSHSDARSGPLKPGDIGTLITKTDSRYRVQFNGKDFWWYDPPALELADAPSSSASPSLTATAAQLVFIPHHGNNVNSAWAVGALPLSGVSSKGHFGWVRGGSNSLVDTAAAEMLEIAERERRTCILSVDHSKLELKLEINGRPGQPPHVFTKHVPETEFPLQLGICGHQGACVTLKTFVSKISPNALQSSMFHSRLSSNAIKSAIKQFAGETQGEKTSKSSKKSPSRRPSGSTRRELQSLSSRLRGMPPPPEGTPIPSSSSDDDDTDGVSDEALLPAQQLTCSSGHPCFYPTLYREEGRTCDVCGKHILTDYAGARCDKCDFDVCHLCAKPSAKPPPPPAMIGLGTTFWGGGVSTLFEADSSSGVQIKFDDVRLPELCEPYLNQCSIDIFVEPLLLPIRQTIEIDAAVSVSLPSFMSWGPYAHFSQMDIADSRVLTEAFSKQPTTDYSFADREIVQEQQQEREEQKEVQTFQVIQPQGDRDPQRDCSWKVERKLKQRMSFESNFFSRWQVF